MLGKRNKLEIIKESTPGLYLNGGDGTEILLPGRYIPKGWKTGDILDVFVYLDSEDRPVATTETPLAMLGDFACLKVISINKKIGAFLDWGLAKNLLLPFRDQVGPQVEVGQSVVVYVDMDVKSSRLICTMRFKKHFSPLMPPYTKNQAVQMLIATESPLGYNIIVDNLYEGLLYHTNLAGPIALGSKVTGYVHQVRPDHKIDLRLDAAGYKKTIPIRDQILQMLHKGGGRMRFDDKSSPEDIRQAFKVSKNTFKLALSALYRERMISFEATGTHLAPPKKVGR
ncbi:MAG: S1-like domain-containing RNA-binding protein [Verrucomicrobiota bacterium]|nr:S1-like domain-containing RNA-binding protein [Verrucomicrobiota bacterium]